jgi:fatty acid CoA ligase FadD9
VQVGKVLDPTCTLAGIVEHVEELGAGGARALTYEAVHGDRDVVYASELDIDRALGTIALRRFREVAAAPRTVVFTGATGFLGRTLLVELMQRLPRDGRVICIVRGEDDAAALQRMRGSFHQGTPLADRVERGLREGQIEVCAGDLMRPQLGLATAAYARLAAQTDAIVHNGALVNHVLSYRSLFGPNVAGTLELARLALAREGVALHFVSSIGLVDRAAPPFGGADGGAQVPAVERVPGPPVVEDRHAAELWPTRAIGAGLDDYAVGYITSKWAAEVLLGQLATRHGVPVSIFRCGVLLPHRAVPGEVNERDAFQRLLYGIAATGLAPRSFYTPGAAVAPYFGGIPVDVAAAVIAAVVLRGTAGLATYHVDEDERAGMSMDTLLDAMQAAGLAIERLPYDEWYRKFRDALAHLPDAARARSPWQIVQRWAAPIDPAARRRFDNTRFREVLAQEGAELVPWTRGYLASWVRSVTDHGEP